MHEPHSIASRFNVEDKSTPGHIGFDVTYWYDDSHSVSPVTFRIRGTDVLPAQENWESLLNEPQRLQLMNRILAEYRHYSNNNDNVRSAALTVTDILGERGKPTSTHLHIHANTDEAVAYHKDCAEANVVRAMASPTKHQGKIRTLYVMASVDSSENGTKTPQTFEKAIPPCGKCCDMLEKYTQPDKAMVYALPGNDGSYELAINTTARTPAGVKDNEVWKIPVHDQVKGHPTSLLAFRKIKPTKPMVKAQSEGWKALTEMRHLPKQDLHGLQVRAMSGERLSDDERSLLEIEKKIHEIKHSDKDTIARLEAAPTPERINEYMVRQIQESYTQRKESSEPEDYQEPKKLRCVIVRFSDGSFHKGMEVVGKGSNAVPSAEMEAIARINHTFHNVTDVWVMEADQRDINEDVMHTSTKEGLERIFKRRPAKDGITDLAGSPIKNTVNIHYIAFNDGMLKGKELENITLTKAFEEFFPSAYIGSAQMKTNGHGGGGGSDCGHSHGR